MWAKIKPQFLVLFLTLFFCGTTLAKEAPEVLSDSVRPEVFTKTESKPAKPVFIADNSLTVDRIFSSIKDALGKFFRDNERTTLEFWAVRKSGEIEYLVEDDRGQITVPKVDVYFSIFGMDSRLHIGTIKIFASSLNPNKMLFTIEAENVFKISVDGQPNKTSRVEVNDKVISFVWDFDLQTIVRHKIELNEIKLVDELGASPDENVGSIGQIGSTGDVTENLKGQWRAGTLLKFTAVDFINRLHINFVEFENKIEQVDLHKQAKAIHSGDETGQLGGWYYGGLFTPQEFLKRAIIGENPLNRLRALEATARVDKQGQSNMRMSAVEVAPYQINRFEALDRFVVQNGSYTSKGSLKLEKLDFLDGSGAKPSFFMPVSVTLPLSASMSDMPDIYKALADVEIANPRVIAGLGDGSFKTESFKALRPILVALTKSNTHLQLDNARLTAGAHEFAINGRVDFSNRSDVGFLSKLKIDATYDAYLLDILNELANSSQNGGAIALVQQVKQTNENSKDNTYKTTLNATTGENGQLRVNGFKMGAPLASFFPDSSSPSNGQNSQSTSAGGTRVEPQTDSKTDIRERLLRLKKLENNGLITPVEAAEKRKKILDEL